MLATFLVHTVLISKVLGALPLKKTWELWPHITPYLLYTALYLLSQSLEGKLKHNVVRKALIGRKKKQNRSLWRVIISQCTNIISYEISKNIFSHPAFIQSFVIFKDAAVTQSETQLLFDVYFFTALAIWILHIYTVFLSPFPPHS